MDFTIDKKRGYAATGNRELDPDLATVMFIHGAGQDHTIWVLPTRYFVRHQRNVLSVDLPGHGRSDGTPLPTIEDMADWVNVVGEETGIFAAPEGGAVAAAVPALIAMGALGGDEEVVLFNTGSGLKYVGMSPVS